MSKIEDHVILIVEDEDAIRLTLRDFLRQKGFNVMVASDGVGALKLLLDTDAITMIVTDYRMEIFGGDYWLRFLRKFCPEKKIIITTGFFKHEYQIPFKVLYKPFDYSELEELIRKELAIT